MVRNIHVLIKNVYLILKGCCGGRNKGGALAAVIGRVRLAPLRVDIDAVSSFGFHRMSSPCASSATASGGVTCMREI